MLFWMLAGGVLIVLIALILAFAFFYFLGAITTLFLYWIIKFFIPEFGVGKGIFHPVLIFIFWPAYAVYALFYYLPKLILGRIFYG